LVNDGQDRHSRCRWISVLTVSRRVEGQMAPIPARPRPPSARASGVLLGVMFVIAVVHVTAPEGAAAATYALAILLSIAAGLYGLSRVVVGHAWPWRFLVLAAVLWAIGGLLSDLSETQGDLSAGRSILPDLLMLPAYLCFGLALYGLARQRRTADASETMIDGIIVAAGSALIVFELLIAPTLDLDRTWIGARVVVSAYPALSMCLLALAARLAFTQGPRNTAFDLLLVGTSGLLVGDVLYALGETGRISASAQLLEVPYLLVPSCMGAAMLHPSAQLVGRVSAEPAPTLLRRRLLPVMIALFMPIVIMGFHRDSVVPIASVVIAGVLSAAAIVRIARAMRRDAELTAELSYRASHDELTGLPVRSVVLERLTQWLDADRPVAVLFIDLDHFKYVNDSLGHAVGDELLILVAKRLAGLIPDDGFVSRQSGDEFIVAVPDCDVPAAAVLAENLRRRVGDPYELEVGEAVVAASIGISHSGRRLAVAAADLLREADTAMYRAKETGRDASMVFDSTMHDRMLRRIELERALRHALEEGDIYVEYQPIVDHPSGRIEGFEALARWKRAGESISPVEFVPIAEDSGLIIPLGWFVLEESCRQLAWWRANIPGAQNLYMSVNVSPRQMRVTDFVDVVHEVLERHGLPGESLWLEITERVVMDDSLTVLALMTGLRSLGVRLAIDDFGTGYSSLSYLKRFPLERVKIDRAFVAGVGVHEADTSLVHAIIAMATALRLETVAEGVEELDQADRLMALGCTSMQGFHFGRPSSSDDVVTMLRSRSALAAVGGGQSRDARCARR
jgi:diguanylate cyclase (GGDEF)-like protein